MIRRQGCSRRRVSIGLGESGLLFLRAERRADWPWAQFVSPQNNILLSTEGLRLHHEASCHDTHRSKLDDLCPLTFSPSFQGGSLHQGGWKNQLPHQPCQPHPHVLRPLLGIPCLRDPDALHSVGGRLATLAVAHGAVLPRGLPAPLHFRLTAPLSFRSSTFKPLTLSKCFQRVSRWHGTTTRMTTMTRTKQPRLPDNLVNWLKCVLDNQGDEKAFEYEKGFYGQYYSANEFAKCVCVFVWCVCACLIQYSQCLHVPLKSDRQGQKKFFCLAAHRPANQSFCLSVFSSLSLSLLSLSVALSHSHMQAYTHYAPG